MRTCFVPFCDVKNKDQPNRAMFLAPKEPKLFAQWSDAIPKVRELKSTDKVCYIHFKPDEVLNTFDHVINGRIIKIKRDRARLKPNAIPCLEMTTKEEWLSHRAKSRISISNQTKNVKISDNTEKNIKLNLNIEESHQQVNDPVNIYVEVESEGQEDQHEGKEEEEEEEKEDDEKELEQEGNVIVYVKNNVLSFEGHKETITPTAETTTKRFDKQIEDLLVNETNNDRTGGLTLEKNINPKNTTLTELTNLFNFLYDNVHDILMPNTLWGIHRCPQRSFLCFSCVNVFTMQATKMLTIKNDGSIQLMVTGNVKTLHLVRDIDDLDSLSILLNKLDVGRLCFGIATNINCDFIVEPSDDNCWFTGDNEQVYLCKFCLPQMN